MTRSAALVALAGVVVTIGACTNPTSDTSDTVEPATTIGASPVPDSTAPTTQAEPSVDAPPSSVSPPTTEPSRPDATSTTLSTTGSTIAPPQGSPPANSGAAPPTEGGQELGPLGSTDLIVDTGEGTVQIGDADIPGLASGFPVPDGLDVQLASETGTDAGYTGVIESTIAELAGFYAGALDEAGFEIVSEQLLPPGASAEDLRAAVFSFESEDREGSVAIASAPGIGMVSIAVTIASRDPS